MKILQKSIQVATLFVAALFFVSCEKEMPVSLTGTAIESEEVTISEIKPNALNALDTVPVVEHKFELNRTFEQPTFLLLEFSTGVRLPILVAPNTSVNIAVNDTDEYGVFTASGSVSAQKMATQRELFVKSLRLSDSLEYLNYIYQDSLNFIENRQKWNTIFVAQIEAHRQALKDLIDEDTTELSNIMAFYQSLGQLELFNPERDFDYYRKVDNGLMAKFPENEHAIYFHKQFDNYKKARQKQDRLEVAAQDIVVGNKAPEIILNGVDGQPRKLSDLHGKVVLIDFWASWCGPCRRANPHLVEVYNTYKEKGFDVFSVSLDGLEKQKNANSEWQNAIAQDGLIWQNHVSDLRGYESEVIEKYGIQGIPFTVLIDAEGTIIAVNLRGTELDDKLKTIF